MRDPAMKEFFSAVQRCRKFIGPAQMGIIVDNCVGEEAEWFRAKVAELDKLFASMPKVYEQESLGDQAIVHLHYFSGSADFYITERDSEVAQYQAYGLADLFGDGGELGYINIVEITRAGVELDLHWQPVTLKALMVKRERRAA